MSFVGKERKGCQGVIAYPYFQFYLNNKNNLMRQLLTFYFLFLKLINLRLPLPSLNDFPGFLWRLRKWDACRNNNEWVVGEVVQINGEILNVIVLFQIFCPRL